LDFRIEPIEQLVPEARELFQKHWDECGFGSISKELEFTIDAGMEMAKELESEGKHVSITARHYGELVGYILATVNNLIHHNEPMFQVHSIFVIRELRKTGLGKEMLGAAESLMYHQRGVRLFCIASNVNKPINGFLESMGYEATDIIHTKRFKELT
jgi:ribosomal protein S18 acetylase RimI-like enzyme